MSSAPVGVFDSGIGGLSVLKALRTELPQEQFIYFADTAHAPYGERGDERQAGEAREFRRDLFRIAGRRVQPGAHRRAPQRQFAQVRQAGMPVTVAVDSGGTSVHTTGPAQWQKRIATGEFKGVPVAAA